VRTERRFDGRLESVPAARRFVRAALADQSRELIDAVELMACELATNCVRHAGTDFELAIQTQDQVRVEVRDSDHRRPEMQFPTPEEPSGRGLRIVEAMADSWGVIPSPTGKTVWFMLPLEPRPEQPA
jgi:serine/threonine-protein kinase RsbW